MRRWTGRVAAVALAATAVMPVMAPPAQAWTCQIKDLPVEPDPGDIACEVVLKVAGFLCSKVGGPCG